MSQRPLINPYATSLVYRNVPDTFKTTYGQSYTKVSTIQASPVYEHFRENNVLSNNSYDFSPYPNTQNGLPLRNKESYQSQHQYESDFERFQLDLKGEYENGKQQSVEYQDQRLQKGKESERGQPTVSYADNRAEQLRVPYDLLADSQQRDVENKLAVCNTCFKSHACMNRLSCGHQYCDECMSRLHGSDNPFRDSVRWHFCCDLCKKWTSEKKVVRLDPYGRSLL